MTNYDTVVNTSQRNASQSLIVELVGPGKDVLDVGCATGYLAQALRANGCSVTGVEVNGEAAERAREHLVRLEVANIEEAKLSEIFTPASFDVVVFGDVLEHLLHPAEQLEEAAKLLRPGGQIVASIPNVAHGSLRLSLLEGRWNYTELGLLDRTHVRFFTKDTIRQLFRDCGLTISSMVATVLDPLEVEVDIDVDELPSGIVDWVRSQPDAYTYQYVFAAQRSSVGAKEVTEAIPAIELPESADIANQMIWKSRDELYNEVQELRERVGQLEHSLLTSRDFAIGAEAQIGRARRDLERQKAETARWMKHYKEAMTVVRETRSSTTWRIGRVILLPIAALRSLVRGS